MLITRVQKRKKIVHEGTVFYQTTQTFILEHSFFVKSWIKLIQHIVC